ncbi:MAG TPA: L-threonylcarbamoyladenylate synthase [Usitatibacteraceae bacterium]|nr:L-threonylcarbamoyladenylate synthase [Usitatibacteraceae bacterium]
MSNPSCPTAPPEAVSLAGAVAELVRGNLVAFPTETVYGLGADATNPDAVAKIFAAKGRPADHPLIVHLPPEASIDDWAIEVPGAARSLARAFWPGPLTLILKKSARVPAAVTGGQDTVGLRIPSHPVAQRLLREFAKVGSGAVAAPSANRFGRVSPTSAQHVRDEFGPLLVVVEGGDCEVGLESTIVDLSRGRATVLRPGGITREEIAAVLGAAPGERDAASPRAPGTLAAHYAPGKPLALVEGESLDMEIARGPAVAVLAFRKRPPGAAAIATWIDARGDPAGYGHDLYANLRRLDASDAVRILVERPPGSVAWEAVSDRLSRAAAGTGGPETP